MRKLYFWFCILPICLIIQGNNIAQSADGFITAQNGILFTHDISGHKSSISTFGDDLWFSNGGGGGISFFTGGLPGSIRFASMSISDEGRVGIGTSIPEQRLHIIGDNPRILVEGSSGNPEVNFKNSGDDNNVKWALYKESISDDLRFYQGGDKVTIENATGNVGIGTTTPFCKLHVNGSVLGTSWNNSSSRDYKKNIETIAETEYPIMLSKVMNMVPTRYEYKKEYGGDDTTKLGFIAEDMPEEVLSKNGKAVDLYELLTLAIGAMKAQQKRIEDLEEQVERLTYK